MNRCLGLVLLLLSLAGCTTPGMYVGGTEAVNQPKSVADEPISFDWYPINASTIRMLNENDKSTRLSIATNDAHEETDSYQYLIGPQDVLRVTVWDHPELNNPGAITGAGANAGTSPLTTSTSIIGTPSSDSTSRVVGDDGTMFYPYVGLIQVAGKSVEQVRTFLTAQLTKSIRDPQIEVVVASYRSKRIYVTGEVKSPGTIPITDVPLRITDAIAASGGLSLDANLSEASLQRGSRHQSLDLYALLYEGDASQNLVLRSGDILNIPEQRFNRIFVLGEVIKPLSAPLPRGRYTLNEALADAGGVSQATAQANQIYVIRGTPDRPQIFHLEGDSATALILAESFTMHPRDIVFVDPAPFVRFGRVVAAILPALQALQAGKYLSQ